MVKTKQSVLFTDSLYKWSGRERLDRTGYLQSTWVSNAIIIGGKVLNVCRRKSIQSDLHILNYVLKYVSTCYIYRSEKEVKELKEKFFKGKGIPCLVSERLIIFHVKPVRYKYARIHCGTQGLDNVDFWLSRLLL